MAIASECIGPLDAAHAHIDDDRYDMIECSAVSHSILDLLLLRSATMAVASPLRMQPV